MAVPALIFDCDGVLADTERDGHRPAFNQAFAEAGMAVAWSEEEYGEQLRIGGGKERMASLSPSSCRPACRRRRGPAQCSRWHKRKTAIYKEIVRAGRLPGRPGVARIVGAALDAGWSLAVASTSAEESVRAVLEHVVGERDGRAVRRLRRRRRAGEEARPGDLPARAASELGVARDDAIVVEDSRNGLLAAVGAGLRCVVTLSSYTGDEDMREALLVVTSLGDPGEPARVVANRSAARPGDEVTLADLEACLSDPLPQEGGGMSDTALGRAELVVRTIAQTAVDNEKHFCDLDAVVGDGDFGYSLARGFEIVLARLGRSSSTRTPAACSRRPRSS